jgi:hypothetical protein
MSRRRGGGGDPAAPALLAPVHGGFEVLPFAHAGATSGNRAAPA